MIRKSEIRTRCLFTRIQSSLESLTNNMFLKFCTVLCILWLLVEVRSCPPIPDRLEVHNPVILGELGKTSDTELYRQERWILTQLEDTGVECLYKYSFTYPPAGMVS